MNFYSLNKNSEEVSFEEAVVKGLAPDKGLYFPKSITPLTNDFFENLRILDKTSIGFEAIKQFIGDEIDEKSLKQIVSETLNFDFPVVHINETVGTLELFHGPTLAFKDVGARFMARCLGYFNKKNNTGNVTVLVATSGDTGGAVADGFLGVDGVDVVILYPKGKVSPVQEKQLTTLGQNITALEVNGTFDDCQAMVKTAFLDTEIFEKRQLTSANSINVARWLPQMFYYFLAYKQVMDKEMDIVFATPSGNFGNICAGMMAQKLGLPIKHFIAATNINDVVPRYLESGEYKPLKSHQTISNAMDVGNPSNFIRIEELHNKSFETLKNNLSSYRYTDKETKEALKIIYEKYNYIADPHGAIGYLGIQEYLKDKNNTYGIFLETAHPVKFPDVVEEVLDTKITIPESIAAIMEKQKKSYEISTYEELKQFLTK